MSRFLALWLVLALANLVVSALLSLVGFHHVDLRYEAFFQLLVVPTAQATVLTWVRTRWGLIGLASALGATARIPLAAVIALVEAAVLTAGWAMRAHHVIGLAGGGRLQPLWMAAQALAAGVLVGVCALQRSWGRGARGRLLAFATTAVACGLEPVFHPMRLLTLPLEGRVPTVLQWLTVYGGIFVVVLVATLVAAATVQHREPLAAFHLEAAAAFGFVVALVTLLGYFLHPFLLEPWGSVARTGLSLAATAALLGAVLLARKPRPGGTSR